MNCPTCGAENDADARFCAECGTPLENPDIEATIIGQKLDIPDDFDSDMTIMSSPARLAEEAKTVAVDQDALADAFDESGSALKDNPFEEAEASLTDSARAALMPSEPKKPAAAESPPDPPQPDPPPSEPTAPPPGGQTGPVSGGDGGSNRKILMAVGGIVLFLVILCCCCTFFMFGSVLSDPDALEDIMRELGSLLLTHGTAIV